MPTDHISVLKNCFHNQPVRLVSGKRYCINSLTDHVPATSPELLDAVVTELVKKVKEKNDYDILIGEEDRGGYLCALVAKEVHKPFTLVKWNPVDLAGELAIDFRNAYTHGQMFLNGIDKTHKKALIIEDLIDTGGTLVSMVEMIRKVGVDVVAIVAVAEKADYKGKENVQLKTGILPDTLVKFICGETTTSVIN